MGYMLKISPQSVTTTLLGSSWTRTTHENQEPSAGDHDVHGSQIHWQRVIRAVGPSRPQEVVDGCHQQAPCRRARELRQVLRRRPAADLSRGQATRAVAGQPDALTLP